MENSRFKEGYKGSTRSELDHQAGNMFTPIKDALDGEWQPDNLPKMAEKLKNSFIAGLTRAVEEAFPVFGGVTHHNLTEVVNQARLTNWTNKNELQELIDMCDKLRKPFDE